MPHARTTLLAAITTLALIAPACTTGSETRAATAGEPSPAAAPVRTPDRVVPVGELRTVTAGITIDHDAWAGLGYRWDWTSPPREGRSGGDVRLVEPLGDLVGVLDAGAWVTALEASSGFVRWRAEVGSPRTIFTALDRSHDLLLVSGRPELFILDTNTGGLLTRQDMKIVIDTPPAITQGVCFYGTPTARVVAHAFGDREGRLLPPPLDRGGVNWQYQLDGAVEARPVIVGGAVGAVTQRGDVFFADYRTGASLGRARIWGGMASDPVTDGSLMFVASLDQSVYAFAPSNAQLVWRHRTASPLRVQPTVHDGTLYVDIPQRGVTAFDALSGSIRWSSPQAAGEVVAVRAGKLVVVEPGRARLLDAASGAVLRDEQMPDVASIRTSERVDGALYALSPNGAISRFTPR